MCDLPIMLFLCPCEHGTNTLSCSSFLVLRIDTLCLRIPIVRRPYGLVTGYDECLRRMHSEEPMHSVLHILHITH